MDVSGLITEDDEPVDSVQHAINMHLLTGALRRAEEEARRAEEVSGLGWAGGLRITEAEAGVATSPGQ